MRNLIYCVCLLSIFSCTQEKLSQQIIGSWEVIELQIDDTSSVLEATDVHFITFEVGISYQFRTDVNSCEGGYEVSEEGDVAITLPSCSYVCCDSEFSSAIIKTFQTHKNKFEINRKILKIMGDGFITLRKVKDE